VAGGPYEEQRFTPSARVRCSPGALKKLYADGMSAADVVIACVQALYDAATTTRDRWPGPDQALFPVIATITADGFTKLPNRNRADSSRSCGSG